MSAQDKFSLVLDGIVVDQDEKTVQCGAARLDLARRPLCYRLFKLFADDPSAGKSKTELIQAIYPISKSIDPSARLMKSLDHNMLKLISRARLLAQRYFAVGMDVDWFAYDVKAERWHLYRPNVQRALRPAGFHLERRVWSRVPSHRQAVVLQERMQRRSGAA